MSFDWVEYLNLARELAGRPTKPSNIEARLRTAIGRAYYAAFCKARDYLVNNENYLPPLDRSVHRDVKTKFLRSRIKLRKGIGQDLDRLSTYRNMADYEVTVPRLSKTVSEALKFSHRIITNLDKLK